VGLAAESIWTMQAKQKSCSNLNLNQISRSSPQSRRSARRLVKTHIRKLLAVLLVPTHVDGVLLDVINLMDTYSF
jgi:hypothetical protein